MAALEYTETPRLERALTKEELRAIARGVREVAEPTPRSIRRRACELLGREPGALDGLKEAVKAAAVAEQERYTSASAERRETFASAFYADDVNGEKRKGKFSSAESVAVCAAAEAVAASRNLTVEALFPLRSENSLYGHVKRQRHAYANRQGPDKRWSGEDSNLLRELFERHGPDWTAIGVELKRTPAACRDRYRTLYGEPSAPAPAGGARTIVVKEAWTDAELTALVEAHVDGTPILEIDDPAARVSFTAVAALVGTRSRQQCRKKWDSLKRRNHRGELLRDPDMALELCEQIQLKHATDESDVVWTLLGWDHPGACTSAARQCWERLRKRHPELPFAEALDVITEELRDEVHDIMLADEALQARRARVAAAAERARVAVAPSDSEDESSSSSSSSSDDDDDADGAVSKAASESSSESESSDSDSD
ncbi:RNA polymerase II transcription regulator recruiting protein [Aureococcus anophagefferens]|nr:RNA polymerase II transcription regulator recruiting protein [Aureococcus anophagefferens]